LRRQSVRSSAHQLVIGPPPLAVASPDVKARTVFIPLSKKLVPFLPGRGLVLSSTLT
jgi:hypothetical protein